MQKYTILSSMPTVINETMISILLFIGLGYLTFFSDTQFIDILPTLALFLVVAQRLGAHTTRFVSKLIAARTKLPSFRLVMEALAIEKTCADATDGMTFAGLTDELRFNSVQFTYRDGRKVLRNFDMVLPKGHIVALIGESGTGKSTIADLILRLRSPNAGAICADGRDISEFDVVSWRTHIGYISQDPFLFNTSILNNILLGKPGASQEEVECASVAAHAHDFITDLPAEYDTNVGERGAKLSGGQRQRIAIARALVRNPDICIFDEPTSALDKESGDLVRDTIQDLARAGKTVLLITHDMHTAKIASIVIDLSKSGIKPSSQPASGSSSLLDSANT